MMEIYHLKATESALSNEKCDSQKRQALVKLLNTGSAVKYKNSSQHSHQKPLTKIFIVKTIVGPLYLRFSHGTKFFLFHLLVTWYQLHKFIATLSSLSYLLALELFFPTSWPSKFFGKIHIYAPLKFIDLLRYSSFKISRKLFKFRSTCS